MSTQRPLPTEILALIFNNLTHQDLFQCVRVSSLWHREVESWLYSTVTLNPLLQRTHSALIQTLKTKKHLLRKVEWRSHDGGGEILPADLLDILLDCRLRKDDEDDDKDNDTKNIDSRSSSSNTNSSFSPAPSLPRAPSLDAVNESKSGPAQPPPSSLLLAGPNRPSLRHFSFLGVDHSGWLLDTVLFNLRTTTLMTLELDIAGCAKTTYVVDFGRILDTFPHLKTFSFIGTKFTYTPSSIVQSKDNEARVTVEGDECAEGPITTRQHPLESLTFDPWLMCRKGPDAFSFFERLGNLKKIEIRSTMSYVDCYTNRPWAFGQTLRRYCPKLESIDTWGAVALWFFDLPILPANKALHLLALVPETSSPSSQPPELTRRLQDQEIGELLQEDDISVPAYFPRLKHLVLGHDNSLGAQDLVLLGVQARFLTHVEIYQRTVQLKYVWDMFDKDAAATAAAADDKSTLTIETTDQPNNMLVNAVVGNRRLRKRREVGSREILLFLQHCSSLCSFSLTGRSISSEDLIDGSRSSDRQDMDDEARGEGRLFIKPWACEGSLESLTIGIDISTKHSKPHHHHYHALVWKHLGRFKKLRSLTLKLSNLIPSPAYGVEGLFEGEGGGSVRNTLEEIRSLPSWWKVEDRQEMVLWFARSCPRLKVLGLEHTRQRDRNGWEDRSFLRDEDVKRCSVGRIFVESAYA